MDVKRYLHARGLHGSNTTRARKRYWSVPLGRCGRLSASATKNAPAARLGSGRSPIRSPVLTAQGSSRLNSTGALVGAPESATRV